MKTLVLSHVHLLSAKLCSVKLSNHITATLTISSLTSNIAQAACASEVHCSIKSMSTPFSSPHSRQLLNSGRLTGVSGQCPAVTFGAFIICLVGSAPVYRGMQPSRSSHHHTNCTGQQLSSPICHSLRRQLLPVPLNSSPTGKAGLKGQQPSFHCYIVQDASSIGETPTHTTSVALWPICEAENLCCTTTWCWSSMDQSIHKYISTG